VPKTKRTVDLTGRLHDLAEERARLLLEEDGIHRGARFSSFFSGPQEELRVHALALLQACTELVVDLQRTADLAAARALLNGASYTEIGAARGISRQAARQRHRKELAEQEARRASFEVRRVEDDFYEDDFDDDEERGRWRRWPPRPWRFRAPTGSRTVRLVGGPADSQTIRIPAGDDAFPYIDHTSAFGPRQPRHARYSPSRPDSDEYRFTGEYYVRWS
jgi:hypothetical protein